MTRPHLLEQACEGPCFPALLEKGRLSPTANSRGPWCRLLESVSQALSPSRTQGTAWGSFSSPQLFTDLWKPETPPLTPSDHL